MQDSARTHADGSRASGAREPRRAALRVTGCLALGAGLALVPSNPAHAPRAGPVVVLEIARIREVAAPAGPAAAPDLAPPAARRPAPNPDAPPAAVQLVAIAVPMTEPPVPFVSPPPLAAPPSPPRAVDVAQVSGLAERTLHVPQLLEPGLAAGGGVLLAAKIDAMQVPLPAPPRLSDEERTALLAEAPAEMTVRIGDEAVGAVAFRMSEARTIDVQLSGLLDIVADRMAPEDYGRLRASDAAAEFVPLDSLRAIGIGVRYDAVYDELDLSA